MEKQSGKRKRISLRRLVVANLLALFVLLFVIVMALFAMGLLGSVLAFIF